MEESNPGIHKDINLRNLHFIIFILIIFFLLRTD